MKGAPFFAAAGLGLVLASAVVWQAPEPLALAHAKEPAKVEEPAKENAPPALPEPSVLNGSPDGGVEPALIGFDAGPSLGELPQLSLPSNSSKSVRFGVILVAFAGAQGAADGARNKHDAQQLAVRLAEEAKTDFKAAVASGDPGSMADAGRIGRGVLEPDAEFALFQLEVGAVSTPVETPRGFWIVKRLD